jgi:anti-anti-sigma factor
MLAIHVESLPEVAVVECKGRIVNSDSVFKLRDFVMARTDPTVVLDLSEVKAIGGGGLGMLAFLDHWARKHHVHLKLFSPSEEVVKGLARSGLMGNFEIASFHEMMDMLSEADSQYSAAA